MKKKGPRPYRQTGRAESARETGRRVLRAAVDLWREQDIDEVTLAEIAEAAEVSVQTLLRRFGSKQGLVESCLKAGSSDVTQLRDQAPVGDVRGALKVLLEHYERDGDAVFRTLQIEARSEVAAAIVAHGRKHHRAWCERVFAPFLPSRRGAARNIQVDAFVGATDVYLWKLWRRDLSRTREQTAAAFLALLIPMTEPSPEEATP